MHFVFSGELPHHRQFVENFCECFRVTRAGWRFSVVFGKFQRIGKQKGVQSRRRTRRAEAYGDSCQALFFFAQVELRKKMSVVQGGDHHPFAKLGDGLRYRAHMLFVFGREKKRPQEGAVNAVAKSQVGSAHTPEQILRKPGHA